ncbi:MAG: hypothetical protein ACQEQV_04570 [Fibrobacterota bacterium]
MTRNAITAILLILTAALCSYSSTVTDQIEEAVRQRNRFAQTADSTYSRQQLYADLRTGRYTPDYERAQNTGTRYLYAFYRGVSAASTRDRKHYFEQALDLSTSNAGKLWLLYLEFEHLTAQDYADKAVDSLYKGMIRKGNRMDRSLGNLFIHLSREELDRKKPARAARIFSHAQRFLPESCRLEHSATALEISSKGLRSTPLFNSVRCILRGWDSWTARLTSVDALVSYGTLLIISSAIILYIILLLRYYLFTIHRLSCIFTNAIPYSIRIIFTSLILLPLLLFFPYPFAVVTSLLFFIHITDRPRKLLALTVVLLFLVYPFLRALQSDIEYLKSRDSAPSTYIRALYESTGEAFRADLLKKIGENTCTPEEKSLYLTSLSLSYHKDGDRERAAFYMDMALKQKDEPMKPVLISAGPTFLISGNVDRGFRFMETALKKYPRSAAANYNYSRAVLEYRNHKYTGDYFKKASLLDNTLVGEITDENEEYFGKKWPPLRRYILGSVKGSGMIPHVDALRGDFEHRYQKIWAYQFFGLSIGTTALIILVLLIAAVVTIISNSSKRSAVSKCNLCGRHTCRKCREGEYCLECKRNLQSITNTSLVESMKVKISIHKRLVSRILGISMNAVFPGSSSFFIRSKPPLKALPYLMVTIFVYTAYVAVYQADFTFFATIDLKIKITLLVLLSLYHIVFIISFLKSLKHELNTGRA